MYSWHLYVPLNAFGSSGAQERVSNRIPILISKCAHLVASAHINLQVKYLTQVCEKEKQNKFFQLLRHCGTGEE